MLLERGPWFLAGPLLGLVIVGLRAALNKPLGALGGYIDLADGASRRGALGFRAFLLGGFALGGLLYAASTGQLTPRLAYGSAGGFLPAAPALQMAVLASAGVVMGFGARTAGGCTSGHGMCGVSLGSPASIATSMTFFATAVVMTRGLAIVLGGAP